MILGTGVDLADVRRIREAIERHGARLTERIFTATEIAFAESKANRYERYAARFAAKEAGMKALGTGWGEGTNWHDFEVENLPSGQPVLHLRGKAAEIAAGKGVQRVHLSLTHTPENGMAFVILEG